MRIMLVDYGTGNLHSLAKALALDGDIVTVANDLAGLGRADAVVLPGVGAFAPAAASLGARTAELRAALDAGLPCLGICIGMQLLFESSDEGAGTGIGVISGHVRRLHAARVPHMGWNTVETIPDPIFDGIQGLVAYYANSYVAQPAVEGCEIAWTEYDGDRFAAAVRSGRTWGVQFHPEKSANGGLAVIRNFLKEAAR